MRLLVSSSILFLYLFSACVKTEEADLVVHNGKILSFNEQNELFEAMAIKDGKIIELGAEHEIMNRYLAAENVDLKKQFVMPGLIDNHAYFMEYGHLLTSFDLRDYSSLENFRTKAKLDKESEIIFGFGWNEDWFSGLSVPDLEIMDSLFPNKAIYLKHEWGFKGLVNSQCIAEFNLESSKSVIKDADLEKMDDWKDQDILENLAKVYAKAETACLKRGLVASSNFGLNLKVYSKLKEFLENSESNIQQALYLKNGDEEFKYLIDHRDTSAVYALLGINEYMPIDIIKLKQLSTRAMLLRESERQLVLHGFGPAGANQSLDLLNELLGDVNDLRWRLENAHSIPRRRLNQFRKNTIIPGLVPLQANPDMDVNSEALYFAYGALYNENKILSIGSSMPVSENNPWLAISRLVSAKNFDNEKALRAMTSWAALARFKEDELGSLESGKQASFLILKANPLNMTQEALSGVEPLSTWIKGKKLYSN